MIDRTHSLSEFCALIKSANVKATVVLILITQKEADALASIPVELPAVKVIGIYSINKNLTAQVIALKPDVLICDASLVKPKFQSLIKMLAKRLPDMHFIFITKKEKTHAGLRMILGEKIALSKIAVEKEAKALELSERETEVLGLIAIGHSYKLICEELHIGYETVRSHVKNINKKMKVERISQAVARARQLKLVG